MNTPTPELGKAREVAMIAVSRAKAAAEPAIRATLAAELPMVRLPFNLREEGRSWDDITGAAKLWLLPPGRLDQIPPGTPLVSIRADVRVVGVDDIDTDIRGGVLAWGLLDAQIAEFEETDHDD